MDGELILPEEFDKRRNGVTEVMKLLGQGISRPAIVARLMEKYGIGHSAAYEWFKRAADEMLPRTLEEKDAMRADISAALAMAQTHAVEMMQTARNSDIPNIGARATAIAALTSVVDRRTKLFGLNEERSGHSIVVNNDNSSKTINASMTSGARRALIDKMIDDALEADKNDNSQ